MHSEWHPLCQWPQSTHPPCLLFFIFNFWILILIYDELFFCIIHKLIFEFCLIFTNYIRLENCSLLICERYRLIYLMLAFDLNAFDDFNLKEKSY